VGLACEPTSMKIPDKLRFKKNDLEMYTEMFFFASISGDQTLTAKGTRDLTHNII
jgi:hypothetical protein